MSNYQYPTGTGPAGAAGSAGANGSTWYSGSGVPSGGTGINGDFYLRTSNGDVYTKVAGSWGSPIENLTGPAGSSGTSGSTWYTGSGVPSGGTGVNGDFYLRTSTGDIYQKVSGSWGSPIENITGPAGSTGATGATGAAGQDSVVAVQVKTASYGVVSGDKANLLAMNSSSAQTFTLPGTVPANGWHVWFGSIGTGVTTLSRNGHNIDGAAADLTLNQFQGCLICSDGTNYYTAGEPTAGGGGGGVSSLNGHTGALTLAAGSGVTIVYSGGTFTISASGGGGGGARATHVKTTASLGPNTFESGTWAIARTFQALKLTVDVPARVRIYSTTGARDADVSRVSTVPPSGQHGVIFDLVLDGTTGLTWIFSPMADGADMKGSPDGLIGYLITNLQTSASSTVTATLISFDEEA